MASSTSPPRFAWPKSRQTPKSGRSRSSSISRTSASGVESRFGITSSASVTSAAPPPPPGPRRCGARIGSVVGRGGLLGIGHADVHDQIPAWKRAASAIAASTSCTARLRAAASPCAIESGGPHLRPANDSAIGACTECRTSPASPSDSSSSRMARWSARSKCGRLANSSTGRIRARRSRPGGRARGWSR